MHTLLLLIAAFWLQAPSTQPALPAVPHQAQAELAPGGVGHLAAWLSGAFSSAEQAQADPAYFDIRLHVVPIWPGRDDGPWLYVEQAAATALDRPYRQRVYRLGRQTPEDGGRLFSEAYTFNDDPLQHAGRWRTPDAFADTTPADLTLRDGCTIYLTWHADKSAYTGSTEGQGCGSSLRGADYVTSEVKLTAETLASWDRGFTNDGQQAWGAIGGAYVFKRQPAEPQTPER